MPQRSLHPLVYILLMWLTIISIVQVVFIAFFFTLGQNGQSSSHRAEEPGGTNVPVATTSPNKTETICEKDTVINYEARVNLSKIVWVASNPAPHLISDKGEQLLVKRDGNYFLNFRVTLESCKDADLKHTVKLKYESKSVLEGWIDRTTCSSGQLNRVKGLSGGEKLEVIIEPPTTNLNTSSEVTYLDIAFMPKS